MAAVCAEVDNLFIKQGHRDTEETLLHSQDWPTLIRGTTLAVVSLPLFWQQEGFDVTSQGISWGNSYLGAQGTGLYGPSSPRLDQSSLLFWRGQVL